MQSRFDAATLDSAVAPRRVPGRLSGLMLSIVLRSAMRLVAVLA